MNKNIYISGHKNPDTDSICSAICYAYLKNSLNDGNNYIPIRLGEVNSETRHVLEYFNQTAPQKINHFKTQVSDLIIPKNTYVKETDSIKYVFNKIMDEVGRSTAVADADERFIGIVSIADILPLYFEPYRPALYMETKTPFKNILEGLEAKIIQISTPTNDYVKGNIYLYNDISNETIITENDIVIFSNSNSIKYTINGRAIKLMIVCNYTEDTTFSITDDSISIVATEMSISETLKSLNHAIPISTFVKKDELVYFTTYETIDDVKENMMTSKHRRFPVVDELGFVRGTISRSNLVDIKRKRAILVDHNESGQSIDGIKDMNIIEVIDHHRVADIHTMSPLYFRVEPVGCTCTIVTSLFEENHVEIPKDIAGLLLSAILSDTLIFNSPTCTQRDIRTAKKLAAIANINIKKYGRSMIDKGSSLEGETYESIINKDMKRFMFGKHKISISQINTSDFNEFYDKFASIHLELDKHCEANGIDLAILIITDLVLGGSELIVAGTSRWIAEEAFKMDANDRTIFLSGVFSRKKQVVPRLMEAAHL